jgi:hypothetical protein
MIVRVALRSLAIRPWRTAVLAAGFGLGIGVMVALLGVGEVILEQAHAPALRGGGDLVVSSAFGSVDSARYVLAHVLGGPALRPQQRAAAPAKRTALYLVKPGVSVQIAARGGVPSLEKAVGDPEVAGIEAWSDTAADASWSNPRAEDILRAMDRFHPIPATPTGSDPGGLAPRASARPGGLTPAVPEADSFRNSWAEWLHFNGRTSDGRLRFYLTFLVGAPPAAVDGVRPQGRDSRGAARPRGQTPGQRATGQRPAFVRLQLERDGRSTSYSAAALVDAADLLARAPDLDIAGNRVRLDGSRYRLTLALAREGAGPPSALEGEIVLDAPPGRSLPPTAIRGARGWVSGYVVPVLSGPLHGSIRTGGETIALDGATGYHDHNWGFWEGVRWQWGQVASGDLSIVFGRVFPPPGVADAKRIPGVLGVLGPDGPIGFATDVSIEETTEPRHVRIRARGRRLDLDLALTVEETVGTRMGLTRLANGQTMTFLQLGGTYRVKGNVGNRAVDFVARGSAETFRAN